MEIQLCFSMKSEKATEQSLITSSLTVLSLSTVVRFTLSGLRSDDGFQEFSTFITVLHHDAISPLIYVYYKPFLNLLFQILTQEDWNLVLYNAMATTSPWAAVYFVAVIIFGKNVLLNVLVGIVVDNFQAKVRTSASVFSKS